MMNKPFGCSSPAITVPSSAVTLVAVALPSSQGNSIRIVNEGPNIAFVALGTASVLATLPTTGTGAVTCTPVMVNEDLILTRNAYTDLFISTICRAAGTSVLTVACGDGL